MKESKATTLRQLLDARALLAEHYTRGIYAEDREGKSVDPLDPKAVCFCAAGALARVTQCDVKTIAFGNYYGVPNAVHYLRKVAEPWTVMGRSDLGQRSALEMFDKAIQLAGRENDD